MVQEVGNRKARSVYEAGLPENFRRPQSDSYPCQNICTLLVVKLVYFSIRYSSFKLSLSVPGQHYSDSTGGLSCLAGVIFVQISQLTFYL